MSDGFSRVQVRKLVDKTALYGITNGTAAANKALVTDSSTNIAGINSLSATSLVTTNLTTTAAGTFINDASDATKQITWTASGNTTGKILTLAAAVTNNRTCTYPDATCTLVGDTATQTLTNKTITDPSNINTIGAIATGSYSQASNTTLANVTGLVSPTLVAGAKYLYWGYLATTNNATGGIKLQWTAGGGLTATALLQDTWVYNTTTVSAQANATALGSPFVNAAVAATAVEFSGIIVVNVAGTMQLQAAQNTSNGTALTVTNNSYVCWQRIA